MMTRNLAALFDVKPGEGRRTLLLWLLSFCGGLAHVFAYSASRALFLTWREATDFPFVYMGVALALLAVGQIFGRVERKTSHRVLAPSICLFLILSYAGLWFWFRQGGGEWTSLVLAVWYGVSFFLTNLAFWSLAGRAFDLRQSKRLYGLIGSGWFSAFFLAGFSMPWAARMLGAVNLLLPTCAGLVLALFLSIIVLGVLPPVTRESGAGAKREGASRRAAKSAGKGYLLRIQLFWGLAAAGYFLADLAFNVQAEAHIPKQEALAGFFGAFMALASAGALAVQGLFSGRVINRLGPVNALFLLPLALAVASLALVGARFAFPDVPVALFWAAAACKFFDLVLRNAVHKPAFMVLYQPLDPGVRLAAQTSVEGFARPAATLVVSAALILLGRFISLNAVNVCLMLLGLIGLWLWCGRSLQRRYPEALMRAVKQRVFGSGQVSLDDRYSVELVAKRLESDNPAEVIYSVELLEKALPETLDTLVLGNLYHSSELVRLDGLARVERMRLTYPLGEVLDMALNAETPAIRGAALRAYAAVKEGDALEQVTEHLEDPAPEVAMGAMVGLINYGGIEGVLAGGEKLMRLARSLRAKDRIMAARTLGEIGQASFYRPLIPLLEDDEPEVRRAALLASAKLGSPRLVPPLAANLAIVELRGLAIKALAAVENGAVQAMQQFFESDDSSRSIRMGLLRAATLSQNEEVTGFLISQAGHQDPVLRRLALEGLAEKGWKAHDEQAKEILAQVRQECGFAAGLWFRRFLLDGIEECALLCKALEEEARASTDRGVILVCLVTQAKDSRTLAEARRALAGDSRTKKALALEAMENVLNKELRRLFMPLLEDLPLRDRVQVLLKSNAQPAPDKETLLIELALGGQGDVGLWTRAAAVYAMGLLCSRKFVEPLQAILAQEEPLLAETGQWALNRIWDELGI